jgi:hypothetical protein
MGMKIKTTKLSLWACACVGVLGTQLGFCDSPATLTFPSRLNYSHMDWLLVAAGPPSGGFSYETASSGYPSREAGRRPDKRDVGVQWPKPAYYQQVLGGPGYDELKRWQMTPVVIYAEKGSSGDFHWIQDMVEGAACVDDTARAALLFEDDYLFNHDPRSLERVRNILTWISYMTTLDGRVYNFVWLDSPKYFSNDPMQAQNKHYGARFDWFARWRYPANFAQVGGDPNADQDGLARDDKGHPVRAPAFIEHAAYSVVMNDLTDTTGRDVAQSYDAPLYKWQAGKLLQTGTQRERVPVSTSFANFNIWHARAIWAFSHAMLVLKDSSGTDETFRRMVENTANRLYANLFRQNLANVDPKMAAILITSVVDYLQATDSHDGKPWRFTLPEKGTGQADDMRPDRARLVSMLDVLQQNLLHKQIRSKDWRDGEFVDSPTGHWTAWGELEIYSLAHLFLYQKTTGGPESGTAALDAAVEAAVNFYGRCAYSYKQDRSPQCGMGLAEMTGSSPVHVSDQMEIVYQKTPIVMGLYELAAAVRSSSRSDAASLSQALLVQMERMASWFIGNNVAHQPVYDAATGAVADGILKGTVKSNSSGGESNVEGLRALLFAQHAISQGWIGAQIQAGP